MKILKYGFFGEDTAQKIFLENYLNNLPKFLNKSIEFEIDEDYCSRIQGRHRTNVKKLYGVAVQNSLAYYNHDLCFIGIDADTEDFVRMKAEFDEMKEVLHVNFIDKSIIFMPIQAIEYWVWYLKLRVENPSSNKNENLEKYPRTRAKEVVYGNVKVPNEISEPIVRRFTEQIEIEWLLNSSKSFAFFHNQVLAFLK